MSHSCNTSLKDILLNFFSYCPTFPEYSGKKLKWLFLNGFVSYWKSYLPEGLDADQLMRLVHLYYIVHAGLNLAVLLIYVEEKLLEAGEHLYSESLCVKFKQSFEKKEFKAVIWEDVLGFSVVGF